MRTIKLKISSSGRLVGCHPFAEPGQTHLIYAIGAVPNNISLQQCCLQANRICFAHRYDDVEAYTYQWSDLAGKQQGAIINRYRSAA